MRKCPEAVTDPAQYRVADRILFGAAYYPEYLEEDRLDEDLRLMSEAGFNLIRMGESVWSTWEPRDGEFELEWLQPILDAAHAQGIAVLLGTPTYAVPPWLMVAHPEIAAETSTGRPTPWGARQEVDTSHPAFRRYAERLVRAIVGRYAGHPAVVGYQVDNEPGEKLPHNPHVFADFKTWLVQRHGSVDAINRGWNLAHWSHRLTDIDELWVPDGNHVPQYDLAWRRFHAERTTAYIDWQVRIVREYATADQFITTCVDATRPGVHDGDLAQVLDLVATNQYLASQAELGPDVAGDHTFPPSGDWAPFYTSDRGWGMRQERFLVTETNAASIGFPWFNHPAWDGQWRQLAWAMIARGARSIGYWHWHTMHASWETYWGGILPHSLQPGRVYRQIAALGREIADAGTAVEGLVPDADVGLVFSVPSRWAFEYHPPLQDPSHDPHKQGGPDHAAYERIVYRLYGGLERAGRQVRLWHAEQLELQNPAAIAASLPTLVVPALVLVGDGLAGWLRSYVAAGGHLVLGVRTATADDAGRIRREPQPAALAEAAGVSYDEFTNLTVPVPVTGDLAGAAESLVEYLQPHEAQPIAYYQHPHLGRWPAATTTRHGRGRVSYLGCVPDLELAASLGRWLGEQAGLTHPWAIALEDGLQVHGATNRAGERLWFVHNFSGLPRAAAAPFDLADLLGGQAVPAGEPVELGPWDVRVFREAR